MPAIWVELFKQKYGVEPELPFFAGEGDLDEMSYEIAKKLFKENLEEGIGWLPK